MFVHALKDRRVCFSIALLVMMPSVGCRAIARRSQSEQSIAARKLSRQGLEAMHQGKWDQAEELFSGALDLSQADDRAHWGYAETLWQRGDRKLALQHMEHAVRLSANDPEAQIRLGRMYYEVGRTADAGNQAEQALKANRSLAEGWALRGDVLAATGNRTEALSAYHQALALEPDYPEVQLAAAEIYATWGRHDRVLATLDRMQDHTGQDDCPCRAHALRGIALQELGRPDEARRAFAIAVRQQPENVDLLYRWSAAEWQAGDVIAARSTIQRAVQLAPDNPACIQLARQLNEAPTGQPALR